MSTGKRSNDNGKTRQYKVVKVDPKKKNTKRKVEDNLKYDPKKKNGKKKKHSKLKKVLIVMLIIFILIILVGIGIFAGIFFSDKLKLTRKDLESSANDSVVIDMAGNEIFDLSAGDVTRKIIPYSEMGQYLPNAYVAIEDKRFYEHSGIDLSRTLSATVTYIVHFGKSSYGGSTITQQLAKNLKDDKDDTGIAGITRKIREMSRAYQIEQMISKQQILEKYLNEIFVGGTSMDIRGVEYGAKYYFSKSAKDLDLAESAFLAGINHSPNSYNPFKYKDDEEVIAAIKKRTKTVLSEMKAQHRINDNSEEEERLYNEAVAEVEAGLRFKEGKFDNTTDMDYHTAAAVEQVVAQYAEEKNIDTKAARDIIYSGGFKIYTTQNVDIQKRMEEEYVKDKYIYYARNEEAKKNKEHTQSGMVIIDWKTGYVVGSMGGLGTDVNAAGYNRATQAIRQTGSAIKPLANVIPGLEEGIITAATVYDDTPTTFGNYSPKNVGSYRGLTTARKAIEVSSNVVNVKMMSNIGPSTSIKYLKDMGLSHIDSERDNNLSLAIGGLTEGATPLEMAAAYAAIANGGEYITPTYYTKVEDSDGNVILEPKQEKKRVMAETTAYITADILKDVVTGSSGTARSCKISGIDVGAKTGTTDSKKDKWLCGITPYYAAATWAGYDIPEIVREGNTEAAKEIWAAIMKDIHKNLKKATFKETSGITSAKICLQTGKLATKSCSKTYTEIFKAGTVPKYCDGHDKVKVCKETGKLANDFCPDVEERSYSVVPDTEINPSWKNKNGTKYSAPTETCDKHTSDNMINVVNVVGKTEAEAKTALSGLNITVTYKSDATKADGTVISQSIAANKKVTKETNIKLVVNKKATTPPTGGNTETPPTGGNTIPPTGGNTETPPPGGNTTTPPTNNT